MKQQFTRCFNQIPLSIINPNQSPLMNSCNINPIYLNTNTKTS